MQFSCKSLSPYVDEMEQCNYPRLSKSFDIHLILLKLIHFPLDIVMRSIFHLLFLDLIKDSILNYLQSCVVCLYFPSIFKIVKLYSKMQRRYSSFMENLKTRPLPVFSPSISLSVLPPLSLTDSPILFFFHSPSFSPSFKKKNLSHPLLFFLFHSLFSIPLSCFSLLPLSEFPK